MNDFASSNSRLGNFGDIDFNNQMGTNAGMNPYQAKSQENYLSMLCDIMRLCLRRS